MKKHFTKGQVLWIIVICLIVELVTNISDVINGFRHGWNGIH